MSWSKQPNSVMQAYEKVSGKQPGRKGHQGAGQQPTECKPAVWRRAMKLVKEPKKQIS